MRAILEQKFKIWLALLAILTVQQTGLAQQYTVGDLAIDQIATDLILEATTSDDF